MEHLSVVCEQTVAACLLAWTLKCHRVVAINMATVGTSAMRYKTLPHQDWRHDSEVKSTGCSS